VTYDLDRFARRPTDLERAIKLYDQRPGVFASVQGDIDLASPDGRTMARVMIAFANKSSIDMSRRIKRKQLELAQAGKAERGGSRPFGYEADRKTIRPDEAETIRKLAERVPAGESLTSICRSLGPTPTGAPQWSTSVLKRMLTNPRVAGLSVYHGTVLLDDNGEPVKAEWPAILDARTWEAVCAILLDPARDIKNGRIDRKYLLSGFLRCKCGTKMYGIFRRGAPIYRCPNLQGCGNTYRRAAPIDEHITELVLRYLEQQRVDIDQSDVNESANSIDIAITESERSLAASSASGTKAACRTPCSLLPRQRRRPASPHSVASAPSAGRFTRL
jgi:site-specific DNA recombinase